MRSMPIQPPQLDANGVVVPHDHPEILAPDILIRRISTEHIKDGRISSMAFQGSSDGSGMSVDIAKLIEEVGEDPREVVTAPPFFCSVQFNAGQVRAEGFQVGYYPLPENPHHGAIWGAFTKGQRNRLRAVAQWFVEGEGVQLHAA
jgi:hypothetical protein